MGKSLRKLVRKELNTTGNFGSEELQFNMVSGKDKITIDMPETNQERKSTFSL